MIGEDCELRFIVDEPAEVDFLATHTPVAIAITKSIVSHDHLKIIGLRGRWGSGKSTIIRQVGDQLRKADPNILIFNYDAWLHQHDPLRRSFMEALVRFLIGHQAADPKVWKKQLKKLSGKLEETTRYDKPIVTNEAKLFFLLAGAFAIGLGFLGKDTFRDAMGQTTTQAGIWTLFLGLALTLGPIAIWTFRWILSLEHNANAPFWPALLFNRNLGRVQTLTQKPIEPTSIEFGRKFQRLMREVETKGKRLVIVIDNIDRVDGKEAMNIWANVRSFFLSSSGGDDLVSESYHPTLILPVDGDSISEVFAMGSDTEKGRKLARSFINKTFDVTFDVPAPVMSDWRRYVDNELRSCLGTAFTEERSFTIKQFLDAWFTVTQTPITPREINKILNHIIALLMQWRSSSLTFETLVYFSINRERIADISTEVRSTGHPLHRFSSDWPRELAALHYGVDLELAGQVLMTQPIRDAIANNSFETIAPYRELPGFGDIFEQVTDNLPTGIMGNITFDIVTNAAHFLSLTNAEAAWKRAAWQNLVVAFAGLDDLKNLPQSKILAERLALFFDHVEQGDAPTFISSATAMIEHSLVSSETNGHDLDELAIAATRLIDFAVHQGLPPPGFRISADPALYLRRLAGLGEFPVFRERLLSDVGMEAIEAQLVAMLSDPAHCLAVPDLALLLASPAAEQMIGQTLVSGDVLINQAEQVIRNNSGETDLCRAAVRTLLAATGPRETRHAALQRLAEDGTLASRTAAVATTGDETVVNSLLAALVWTGIEVAAPLPEGWRAFFRRFPDASRDINKALNDLMPGKVVIDTLLKYYDEHFGARDLITAMMNDRVRNKKLGRAYPDKILNNLSNYSRMLDWSLREDFARQTTSYQTYWETVDAAPWSDSLLETAKLLEKQGGDEAVRFRSKLIEKVKKATVNDWQTAISDGKQPYRIVTELLDEKELKLGVQSPLVDALLAPSMILAASKQAALARWFALALRLSPKGRRKVLEAMRDTALELSPAATLKLLKMGGARFLAEASFESRAAELVDKIALPLARSKDGRAWLKDRASWLRKILDQSAQESRHRFRNAVAECAASTNDDKRHWGEMMQRLLG
ncbi:MULTISPECIES: P-loop NTPase fold protein [unclassified Sphingopyxis]|uniref:P-loop NTPase fold protein n=1 Tax=unclassified Sphingopyxis TaxID=2614943 RepID=UPI00285507B8|nr:MULTISPECIES: P-loop NTPase fold protein [unclassified Sphingopyxis]MDR6831708.1 hypothetical protein [Sphingopyxis sp. BE122]MDR7227450.1 hypothetical protein [Sphingopyxis sp. BE259]